MDEETRLLGKRWISLRRHASNMRLITGSNLWYLSFCKLTTASLLLRRSIAIQRKPSGQCLLWSSRGIVQAETPKSLQKGGPKTILRTQQHSVLWEGGREQ